MTGRIVQLISVGLVCASLQACVSTHQKNKGLLGPTLANIEPVVLAKDANAEEKIDGITIDKVENYYRSALSVANDDGTRRNILLRLAALELLRSENQLLASTDGNGSFFSGAIEKYKELIALQQKSIKGGSQEADLGKKIDEMLYQLSKAYSLDGRIDQADTQLENITQVYPSSVYTAEAQFRRAEQAFSNKKYKQAEALYLSVVEQGQLTPFYQNAIYMYGWSQFKRSRYEQALNSFVRVLDNLYGKEAPLKTLGRSQVSLAEDTMRVMSLSFAYMDGPKTLDETANKMGERAYWYKLYIALGELYLEKKRYRDSADTYRQYVKANPLSDLAPDFSGRVIDVYEKGDFPSLLIPAKEEYVNNYGINSEYWRLKPEAINGVLSDNLKTYLDELAKYEHAKAQQLTQQLAAAKKVTTGKKVAIKDPKPFYLKAANWYDQYIRTFPKDVNTFGLHFLMAEALNDADELEKAYIAYNAVAYDYPLAQQQASDQTNDAEAGYSAVLIAQQLVERFANSPEWQNKSIDSALNFAKKYAVDKRAVNVLSEASNKLLALGRQPEAIVVATQVAQWQPVPSNNIRQSAWLVVAQSEYDLKNFSGAENAYAQALTVTDSNDPQRQSIIDRRAASLYKISEALLANNDKAGAIQQLLSIQRMAPNSDIAATAQYDAGNYLMELQRWQEAEQVFVSFEQNYSQNVLAKTLPAKFVVIYQELGQWDKAANALSVMANSSNDPDVRRQSLLLAADLYEKSGNTPKALTSYENYIQQYPQPFDEAIEATSQLAKLYGAANNTPQQERWLQQLITQNDSVGQAATQRSTFLAAEASSYFAQQRYQNFKGVPLTLPLKRSLKSKQAALKQALSAYQKVIDYGVARFATQANYFIGDIYVQLSEDLINSERPKGLDALASEQYEVLLEEQAYPFEEKAIELHRSNAARAKDNLYDEWVKKSYQALAELNPGKYRKPEQQQEVIRALY